MSHIDSEKENISRKITYQVGWKKGSIQLKTQVETVSRSKLAVEDMIWRGLPFIPQSAIGYLIWLLPALSLSFTILLIYALLTYTSN